MMTKKLLAAVLIIFLLLSCADLNGDINVNPNTFTSAPDSRLLLQSQLGIINISSGQISRHASLWTGNFSASCGCSGPRVEPEAMSPLDFNGFWEDIFLEGCKNSFLTVTSAQENDHPLEEGVAKIMHAIYLGEGAALWGDIPCRETFDIHSNPHPHYDPQLQVLRDVQVLLKEGLELVGNAKVADVHGAPVFYPNEAKWKDVAHSLKARYYLIAKDYDNALKESRMGISVPGGDLLSWHRDEDGAKNLYYQFLVEQRGGYIHASDSHLVNLLTGNVPRELSSPGDLKRFDHYFQKSDDYSDTYVEPNTTVNGYFAANASFPVISWIETRLIEAEAAVRTGNEALTPFNLVRDWLASKYESDFPHSDSSGEKLLKEILEEKYISMIASVQTFHDMRRTGNILEIPFLRDENAPYPERFLYPQVEIDYNANFPGLIDVYEPTPVNQ